MNATVWTFAIVLQGSVCSILAQDAPPPATRQPADPLDKFVYPLAGSVKTPDVTIDVSETPDVRPWAERAQKLAHAWWPMVAPLLATDRYSPPAEIKLVFKETIQPPAYAAGSTITIKAPWIRAHPDDFGMVIHEMTHIIQHYPREGKKPGWLVEGIADYIRWWRYEPETKRTPIDPDKASYRDSYRTTAWFLAWITGKYDRSLVRRLDESLRDGKYADDLFKESTGKTVDELWAEFTATLPKRM